MEPQTPPEPDLRETVGNTTSNLVHGADEYLHQNPVPLVLGALAIGFLIGLMAHGSDKPASKVDVLKDRLEETEEHLRSLLTSLNKAGKKKYRKTADSVRDTIGSAMDSVKDIDVDDYVDPASKWFRKLWKKYAS